MSFYFLSLKNNFEKRTGVYLFIYTLKYLINEIDTRNEINAEISDLNPIVLCVFQKVEIIDDRLIFIKLSRKNFFYQKMYQ